MKRLIFVDDEQNVLDGFRRMLHSQRQEWEMTFASSGSEALAAMAEEPFDVVVTDMKMPGMSGAELLTAIQDLYPSTIRIVLSGFADLESSMRSVSVSHQFLTKPCDKEALKSVIDRACQLDDLLQQPSIVEALGTVSDLPVLPSVYRDLTHVLSQEDVDVEKVGTIVEADPGIAAKILQLVNSSFFGLRREITSLRHAVAYLGVNTIRDLVLSFEMFELFDDSALPTGFSLVDEQQHSQLAARIAARIVDDKIAAEHALLAALLHDIGKLVLATRLPEPFRFILEAGAGVEQPFYAVEEEILGVTHAEVGAYLLGLWGLSYPVVEAVAHHHHPGRVAGQIEFGALGGTHVANFLALEQAGLDPAANELDEQYLDELGVLERVPEWRTIAAEEAEHGDSAGNTEAA